MTRWEQTESQRLASEAAATAHDDELRAAIAADPSVAWWCIETSPGRCHVVRTKQSAEKIRTRLNATMWPIWSPDERAKW